MESSPLWSLWFEGINIELEKVNFRSIWLNTYKKMPL